MTDKQSSQDLPEIVASVMVTIPPLVFRTGWAYLKMRKRAQKISRQLERQFVSGGIPSEYAEKLAEQFETELSLRSLVKGVGGRFSPKHP